MHPDGSRGRGSGRAAPRARLFRAVAREVRAFARLATLLPRDLETVVPVGVAEGEDVVLLVHGALATAGAWRPLRARLEDAGWHTATFTYGPGRGVREIAASIGALIDRLPAGARVHLVGHSLGGLAVRWFVQETRGDARVAQTIAVASPFSGATGASLLPGQAGRDMRRGSPVLGRLMESAARPLLPHVSIFGTADTAVPADTAFPAGEHVLLQDTGHNALLFDDGVAERIIARVRASRGE